MANLHPRRHGALAAFLVVPFLAGQLLVAPTARAAPGSPALPAATGQSDAPKPLSSAQLSRRLTREVYGYLPYWELDSTTDAYLRYDLLSTISLFSFRYGSDGRIVATSAADRLVGPLGQTIIGHAHAAGVRVELAFSFSGVPAVNNDFFADNAATTTAIAETLDLLARTGADGVNLDVERLSNASFPAYGAFIGRLRKAVVSRNPAGRVTVAMNGAGSGALMAATAIDNGADRAFLMGYSYRSSGSSPVGSNSPVVKSDGDWDITSSLAEYARRGVLLDRVILGLPYYGMTRPTVDASLHAKLRTGFRAARARAAGTPATRSSSSATRAPSRRTPERATTPPSRQPGSRPMTPLSGRGARRTSTTRAASGPSTTSPSRAASEGSHVGPRL